MAILRWFDPEKHHRRSIRLKGYDYSGPGRYFVTICTHGMVCIFGRKINDKLILNQFGHIAHDEWNNTKEIRPGIALGPFVVMPNHIHGIIIITRPPVGAYGNTPINDTTTEHPPVGAYSNTPINDTTTENATIGAYGNTPRQTPLQSPSGTVGAIIRGYKSVVTKKINIIRNSPKTPVWQRNYYETIIRDDEAYEKISNYIKYNPKNWDDDACT